MRTSTAEKNGFVCPKCGERTATDKAGRGFVRHLSRRAGRLCAFEKGLRDPAPKQKTAKRK